MSSSVVSTPNVSSSSDRFIGRVKWFNNKTGYGFITITDGPKSGIDVFVHHSSIKVDSEQYKYLVQGEYVDFNLSDTKTQNHEFQAGEVCGIKGGKLMCETRHHNRVSRSQYRSLRPTQYESSVPVIQEQHNQHNQHNQRFQKARGHRTREEGGSVWTYVVSNTTNSDGHKSSQITYRPVRDSGRRAHTSKPVEYCESKLKSS